jgi:hypothetical protein
LLAKGQIFEEQAASIAEALGKDGKKYGDEAKPGVFSITEKGHNDSAN